MSTIYSIRVVYLINNFSNSDPSEDGIGSAKNIIRIGIIIYHDNKILEIVVNPSKSPITDEIKNKNTKIILIIETLYLHI
jgi:hypothetical protein